jgi:LacI family transcriptional regulator
MTVSLKTVAERAGVSGATISRVLNGKNDRIPIETQERIIKIASEMGYRSNRFLRNSREGKTSTIGLMIAGLLNPFFVSVMESAERNALKLGYQVVLDPGLTVRGSYETHGKLQDWPVDGIVMWARTSQTIFDVLGSSALRVPAVYIGDERTDNENYVALDLASGTREIVKHLICRGYRSMTYVAPYDFRGPAPDPRVAAYLQSCVDSGIEPQYFVMDPQEETFTAGLKTGMHFGRMDSHYRPRALVCHNDVIAVGVYNGLKRCGIRVPQDVALTGYDGIELGQCLDIPLTTIAAPVEEMCSLAMQILARHITTENTAPTQHFLLPVKLLVGGTT